MPRSIRPICTLVFLVGTLAFAQSSASFDAEEHVLNSGGSPAGGNVSSSPGYRVTLAAIGESVVATGTASASFTLDSSFAGAYPPPGEVTALEFTDPQTLAWAPERSTGDYDLYRGVIGDLSGLGFGTCLQQDLPEETATDVDPVPAGDGFFYLVTASNRLDENGTKGYQGDGTARGGAVCP